MTNSKKEIIENWNITIQNFKDFMNIYQESFDDCIYLTYELLYAALVPNFKTF